MNEFRINQLKSILVIFPSVSNIIRDIKLDYTEISDDYFGELQINFSYDAVDIAFELLNRSQDREEYDKVPFKDRSPFGKLEFIIKTFSSMGHVSVFNAFQPREIPMGNLSMSIDFQPRQISTGHLSMSNNFQPREMSMGSLLIDRNQLTRSIPKDHEMEKKEFSMMAHVGNEFVQLIDETLELSGESLKLFLRVRYDMVEE